MAKKDKKSKKVDNSWEDEIGEAPPPKAGEEAPPQEEPAADDAAKAPEEGNMDDEFGGGLLGAIRANRNKKNKKQPAPESEKTDSVAGDEEGGDGKIKSKKEKEKEKKEREKQRKKEQAARKKTTAPPPAAKEKEKEKVVEEKAAPSPAPEPKAAAGKKGKAPSAAILALRKQQEERKRREEELARLEEEARKAEEEERKRIEEEEKKKEEAKQRKKEREKEKQEQLKREGKFMTKAQKEAQKKNELRRQQMIDAGNIVVAGLEKEGGETEKKKKPTFDRKKKKGPVKGPAAAEEEAKRLEEAAKAAAELKAKTEAEEKAKAEAAAAKKAEEEAAKAAAAAEEDDLEDDWEAALEKEEKAVEVKESWDDESDGEDAKPAAKPAQNGKGKVQEESEDESEEESSEDEDLTVRQRLDLKRKEEAAARRQKQLEEAKAAASKDDLRSPICCILGHVDTGKTKLLDKIRQTNVQEGEAGGITQQIGATYFPVEAIRQKTEVVNQDGKLQFKIPGLLIIDTPGHESFTNLRSRGSSLCNIAILVVDIMHGLEPQTIESLRMLKDRKTPFIVALNKIDRLYDWKKVDNNGFHDSLAKQAKATQNEFRDRLQQTILAFAEQGLNAVLFSENKNQSKYVSLVPTSAHTGEGIPDLLKLLTQLTQERMVGKLMYLSSLECTVLEVKQIEGLGTTIDVILSNGVLREGDRIVLCGLNGPICTNVRALLTPQPLRELRVKSQYVHNKEVKAALGVKIAANDLENAIAGSRLLVCGPDDDEEDLEDDVMGDLEGLLSKISTTGKGVCVQASTLGSLEALLEFLRVSKIPVMSISIGPVYKRDVMKAVPMLEKNKEFAVMLCFDVKVDKEAQQYADETGVKIFTADIIYHLFDAFTAYQKEMLEKKRAEAAANAVYPCILRPVHVFNKKDPIVVGVDVVEGSLRIGTPIVAIKTNAAGEREIINLGRVTSIRLNETNLTNVKKGHPSVAMKVEGPNQPLYGRHLEEKDILYSQISRVSIDTLKDYFRDTVTKDDWALIVKLKSTFNIS